MVMEEIKFGFELLELWKKVREFKNEISADARKWPTEEKFRLTDQVIRSSRSINALLAEGHGRFTFADQLHFCIQSPGSLAESVNHLIDAFDEKLNYYKTKAKEIERLLNGYINYLRTQEIPVRSETLYTS